MHPHSLYTLDLTWVGLVGTDVATQLVMEPEENWPEGLRRWDQTPRDSWSYLKVDEARKDPQPQPLKEANASALNLSLPQHPDRHGTLTKSTGEKAQP